MKDIKVPRVKEFKYLESMVQESGSCDRKIKKRVQAGRNRWRRVSGVIYDRRLPVRVKGKVYSLVMRPAMVYGLQNSGSHKETSGKNGSHRDENVEVCYGSDGKDKIRNEYIGVQLR